MVQIREKITIKEKESASIPTENLLATLRWKTSVDLDLWCIYKEKNGSYGTISFNNKGSLNSHPFIQLDQDSGVGDTGGDNEENIRFKKMDHLEHVFICANIYGKPDSVFSKYDGSVNVKSDEQEFIVPLTNKSKGSWCVVAHFDNSSPVATKLENVNSVLTSKPSIDVLLNPALASAAAAPKKKGFLSGLFG